MVERITNLKINDRNDVITAICGNVADTFIDNDLKKYTFNQQLYLYLKDAKFKMIVFYDRADGLFSYEELSLENFNQLNSIKTDIKSNQYRSDPVHDGRPLGNRRLLGGGLNENSCTQTSSLYEIIPSQKEPKELQFFQIKNISDTQLIASFEKIIQSPPTMESVLIFNSPKMDVANEHEFISRISTVVKDAPTVNRKNKILIIYGMKDVKDFSDYFKNERTFFTDDFFRGRFLNTNGNNNFEINENTVFDVSFPDKGEIRNLLNYKRLTEPLNLFGKVSIDKICTKLCQERMKNSEILSMNLSNYIDKISNKTAWDELKALKGIEPIIIKLKNLVALLQKNKENKEQNKKSNKIRPHVVFKGPPGTGKTTVAKLFANILQEEGVLSIGHFICPEEGVGAFTELGRSRIKSHKICKEAIGGVLFIDEAYGFVTGDINSIEMGKEACEVLIQFMEKDDFLLIVAGYENEIDEFIKKGNAGLKRRFVKELQIKFEDYPLNILYEILDLCIERSDKKYSKETKEIIKKIIEKRFNTKTEGWGNAGEVENLINEIELENVRADTIDVSNIPQDLIDTITLDKSKFNGLAKLEALIGLSQMKETLYSILKRIKVDKIRVEQLGIKNSDYKLNFVFQGNPGTGKTTVAQLMGEILCEYGLLSSNEIIDGSEIIGRFMGDTENNVKELFESAIGKVLFIDEAYKLIDNFSSGDGYGKKAIDKITEYLTKPKYMGKMAVIIAGYPVEMQNFINQNPGLKRRFNYYIDFEDYSDKELLQIFKKMVADDNYQISEKCQTKAIEWFEKQPREKNFENAGLAEELLGKVTNNFSNRILNNVNRENEFITTFIEEDFNFL